MAQEIPFHTETTSRFLEQSTGTPSRLWGALEIMHPGDPKAQLQTWINQTTQHIRSGGPDLDEDDHTYREAMAGLCRRAGLSSADTAADLLILMSEGAKAARQYEEPKGLSDRFRRVAEATVARLSRRNAARRCSI